ncbi:MAG TPA: hypothetical protein PLL78_04545 [Fimbriimonadaceae bacterium]|nr:hypothetical protein [Fimbriimonadaceae bacterium]HRJ95932.1 hypothetical protein [Fimbriimonadaceae bacterium]
MKKLTALVACLALAAAFGCGKKEETEKTAPAPAKTSGGRLEVPPPEKHVSVSPPSEEMKGEWVLEPSEKQREINAKLVAMGKKPTAVSLKIEGGKFELHVTSGPSERTTKGDAKQDGKKITLTATSVEAKVNDKPVKSPLSKPEVFTLQDDGLTIKDSAGLTYVRK